MTHPALVTLLRGLGQLGRRAAAAAVDTALEEAEVVVDNVRSRLRAGREQAAEMKQRPKRHINVEAHVIEDDGDDA